MQSREAKPIRTAILIGILSAVLTWAVVYIAIHKPTSRRTTEGSILFLISCPGGDDDDLTATISAAGAYVLTFTSTLLFLRGRVPKNVFAR